MDWRPEKWARSGRFVTDGRAFGIYGTNYSKLGAKKYEVAQYMEDTLIRIRTSAFSFGRVGMCASIYVVAWSSGGYKARLNFLCVYREPIPVHLQAPGLGRENYLNTLAATIATRIGLNYAMFEKEN